MNFHYLHIYIPTLPISDYSKCGVYWYLSSFAALLSLFIPYLSLEIFIEVFDTSTFF